MIQNREQTNLAGAGDTASPAKINERCRRDVNNICIKRKEIYHINAGNTTTTGYEMWPERPAIIISNDVACEKAGFVNIIYLTTQRKNKKPLPTHIPVLSGDKTAIALCEQIYAVDKSRIGFKIGEITEEEMKEIEKAIMFSLGISNTVKPSTIFKKWANAVERYGIDEEDYADIYNSSSETSSAKHDLKETYSQLNADYKALCQNEEILRKKLNKAICDIQRLCNAQNPKENIWTDSSVPN